VIERGDFILELLDQAVFHSEKRIVP
jgi:hypothetical protein